MPSVDAPGASSKSEGVVPSYATRLFRLTILAPDIVSAILTGKQPPELTARRLMRLQSWCEPVWCLITGKITGNFSKFGSERQLSPQIGLPIQ